MNGPLLPNPITYVWRYKMKQWTLATLMLISASATAGGTATPAVVGGELLNLDAEFGGDGALGIQIAERDYGAAGFLENNGDVVLFGYSDDGLPQNGEAIMLRLAPDGTEDTMTRFEGQAFGCSVPRRFLTAMRLSGGDYLAGGYIQSTCGGIPRFFNALQIEQSGIRRAEFEQVEFNKQLAYIFGLAEQPDGKVIGVGLISGTGFDSTTYDFGVARFLQDGTLDDTFGSGGTFTYDLAGDLDYGRQAVVTQEGQILVTGFGTNAQGDTDVLVLALTSDGALDPSFGTGGVFQYDRAGFGDNAPGIARATGSGRIFLGAGTRPNETTQEVTVIGLTADGNLDPGFSDDGIATVDFGTTVAGAAAITLGPAGKLYVTGSGEYGGLGFEFRDGVLAVLLQDGRMDPNFNNGAGVTFRFGDQPTDFPQHVSVNDTGTRILVSGYTENVERTSQQFGAARFIGPDPFIFSDSLEAVPD